MMNLYRVVGRSGYGKPVVVSVEVEETASLYRTLDRRGSLALESGSQVRKSELASNRIGYTAEEAVRLYVGWCERQVEDARLRLKNTEKMLEQARALEGEDHG